MRQASLEATSISFYTHILQVIIAVCKLKKSAFVSEIITLKVLTTVQTKSAMVKNGPKSLDYDIEKSNVLQEAKVFHESPVNPRKCTDILANVLYMINKG